MKPIHFLVGVGLLLASVATALGGEITIDAPSAVAAGDNIQMFVNGINSDELPKAIATHWPEERTTFVAAKTWGNQPFIWFSAQLPGKYLIEITVPRLENGVAVLGYARTVLIVGGEPEPAPNPTPPPVPPVPGERSFVVVCETGTRTATEAAMLGKLLSHFRSTDDRYFWRIVDKDTIDGTTGKTPLWLLPYLTALNKTPTKVPALVVAVQSQASNNTSPNSTVFSVVAVEPLAGLTGEQDVALVKKHGGTR